MIEFDWSEGFIPLTDLWHRYKYYLHHVLAIILAK